eukprot:11761756-Alexandrium_andersonii.AAC.1
MRSPELACLLAPIPDLDPHTAILLARVRALRREHWRDQTVAQKLDELLVHYCHVGHGGEGGGE